MAALAAFRASTAGAAVHLALPVQASLLGHVSDLLDTVKGGVLFATELACQVYRVLGFDQILKDIQ